MNAVSLARWLAQKTDCVLTSTFGRPRFGTIQFRRSVVGSLALFVKSDFVYARELFLKRGSDRDSVQVRKPAPAGQTPLRPCRQGGDLVELRKFRKHLVPQIGRGFHRQRV